MTTEGFKHKLNAILSADVKGYSSMITEDEDATLWALTAYLKLMSTLIQEHRSRVVDSPGGRQWIRLIVLRRQERRQR